MGTFEREKSIMAGKGESDFRESEHPRDENGMFTSKGTSTYPQNTKYEDILTYEREKSIINTNKRFLAVNYSEYTDKGLKGAIRSYQKNINEHNDKLLNPEKYIPNYNKRSLEYQKGVLEKWKKEIQNFENQYIKANNEIHKRSMK